MSIEIIEENYNPTRIKVMGIGGGGCNAIERMITTGIHHVEFIAANTDLQALNRSRATKKIQLGVKITRGLGAGADPDLGRKAAEEQLAEIEKALRGSDVLFLTAGMGGGTGTGAIPVIAHLARKLGCLTIAVVTKPFHFEMGTRMRHALAGIAKLRDHVDTLITIPNQNLLNLRHRNLSISEAFKEADSVLMEGVRGISDLIAKSGFVNVDFADIKAVMKDKGNAILSVIEVAHDIPPQEIAESILNNPLLERSDVTAAQAILLNVAYGQNTLLSHIDAIVHAITEKIDPQATCIYGFTAKPSADEDLKLTMIATGFPYSKEQLQANAQATQESPPLTMPPAQPAASAEEEEHKTTSPSALNKFQTSLQALKARVEAAKNQTDPPTSPLSPPPSTNTTSPPPPLPDKIYTFSADSLTKRPAQPTHTYNSSETLESSSLAKASKINNHSPLEKSQNEETSFDKDDLEIPTFLRAQRKLDL